LVAPAVYRHVIPPCCQSAHQASPVVVLVQDDIHAGIQLLVSQSRGIALNETSHDHGRHRRARDAGVLPIHGNPLCMLVSSLLLLWMLPTYPTPRSIPGSCEIQSLVLKAC